jgi:hypothetical protein
MGGGADMDTENLPGKVIVNVAMMTASGVARGATPTIRQS